MGLFCRICAFVTLNTSLKSLELRARDRLGRFSPRRRPRFSGNVASTLIALEGVAQHAFDFVVRQTTSEDRSQVMNIPIVDADRSPTGPGLTEDEVHGDPFLVVQSREIPG